MRALAQLGSLDASPAQFAADLRLLAPEERAQATRYRFDRDRRCFIARRGFVRRTLGAYLGTPPAALRIAADPLGKPKVAGGPPFSVSHSRDTVLIVIGDDAIGCDIEWRDAALASPGIARRFFAPAEIAALDALEGEAWQAAFFECWVRKEAYVKALGEGLYHPLDGFVVSIGAQAALRDAAPGWAIAAARPRPALHMAVVARAAEIEISWIDPAARAAAA